MAAQTTEPEAVTPSPKALPKHVLKLLSDKLKAGPAQPSHPPPQRLLTMAHGVWPFLLAASGSNMEELDKEVGNTVVSVKTELGECEGRRRQECLQRCRAVKAEPRVVKVKTESIA